MSTRSYIIRKIDTLYEFIYCHMDSTPQHHMPILTNYYNTDDKVAELLSHGEMSSLSVTTDDCRYFGRDFPPHQNATAGPSKTFSAWALSRKALIAGLDYIYLWKDNKWQYFTVPFNPRQL